MCASCNDCSVVIEVIGKEVLLQSSRCGCQDIYLSYTCIGMKPRCTVFHVTYVFDAENGKELFYFPNYGASLAECCQFGSQSDGPYSIREDLKRTEQSLWKLHSCMEQIYAQRSIQIAKYVRYFCIFFMCLKITSGFMRCQYSILRL